MRIELEAAAEHVMAVWNKRRDILIELTVEVMGICIRVTGKHPNGIRCGCEQVVSWEKIATKRGSLVEIINAEIARLDKYKAKNP